MLTKVIEAGMVRGSAPIPLEIKADKEREK